MTRWERRRPSWKRPKKFGRLLKQNKIELRKDWTPDPPFYLTNHADERTASKSNNLSKSPNNNFTPRYHVQNLYNTFLAALCWSHLSRQGIWRSWVPASAVTKCSKILKAARKSIGCYVVRTSSKGLFQNSSTYQNFARNTILRKVEKLKNGTWVQKEKHSNCFVAQCGSKSLTNRLFQRSGMLSLTISFN